MPVGDREIQRENSPTPHAGTPQWEVHIAVLLHPCTSAVATGIFESNYGNFRSLEIIKLAHFEGEPLGKAESLVRILCSEAKQIYKHAFEVVGGQREGLERSQRKGWRTGVRCLQSPPITHLEWVRRPWLCVCSLFHTI